MSESIRTLLDALLNGNATVEEVEQQLQQRPLAYHTHDACVDVDRFDRCGHPEVVYCAGKTAESVASIFEALLEHDQDCLGTRVSADQAALLTDRFPQAIHNTLAHTVRVMRDATVHTAKVAVVSAGTSDAPVAAEACETLHWMRCQVDAIHDVGVAGPHRLQGALDRIRAADAVVVVAGMEGALPSVVGGYVRCPVIAAPTSVGYGANLGGLSALLAMLNSCAANVAVVNIDAGFKAGYVAGMIALKTHGLL